MAPDTDSTTQVWFCFFFWCLGVYLPEPKYALLPSFYSFCFSTVEQLSCILEKTHCRKWYLPFDL